MRVSARRFYLHRGRSFAAPLRMWKRSQQNLRRRPDHAADRQGRSEADADDPFDRPQFQLGNLTPQFRKLDLCRDVGEIDVDGAFEHRSERLGLGVGKARGGETFYALMRVERTDHIDASCSAQRASAT